VINTWKEYFQDLYEGTRDMEGLPERLPIREPSAEEDRLPTTEEVLQAIEKLKNNRVPGRDGLNAELTKVDDNKLTHRICKVIEKVWRTEKIPQQWEEGLICPILKKDDCLVCENYHGITLLNTAYKMFSNILFERLQPYVEKIIGSYQCGFRSGKSTSDQIHTVRQIMEKMGEYGVNTFYLFLDFKAAYDSIAEMSSSRLWRNSRSLEN
jgi:sorting nexin-29